MTRAPATPAEAISAGGDHDVEYEGLSVPVRVKLHPGAGTLVVLFHGAIDRKARPWPAFAPWLPIDGAHQIAIADTTLRAAPGLAAGWYLGTPDAPLQSILPGLIGRIAEGLGVKRRIYVGGSSGGFAALYYAWADPGSVAVAVNPQINLNTYIPRATEALRSAAWPETPDLASLGDKVCLNVGPLYGRSYHSLAIYIQSRADPRHMQSQFPAFVPALRIRAPAPIVDIGYWGIAGHSGSVPTSGYLPWVKAAMQATSLDRFEIIDLHHRLAERQRGVKAAATADRGLAKGDIDLADQLAMLSLATEDHPDL